MTGLTGGRSVMPAKPRPGATGASPARKPFRSMPAQKLPPAPVSTSTRTSLRASKSSMAAAIPRATSPLTALRACGRLIVMTPIPSAASVSTASVIVTSLLIRVSAIVASLLVGSLGLEPDTAVKTDHLSVQVVVLDQRADQVSEFGGRAHPLRKDHRSGQLGLELLAVGPGAVDRRVNDARADGVDADADRGEIAGGGHGHADDPALGGGIRDLAGLPFEAGDGGSIDDHA